MDEIAARPIDNPGNHVVPWFELPLAGGGRLRSTTYRGRANLIVLALPDAHDERCVAAVRAVADHDAAWWNEHAQPIAVVASAIPAAEQLWKQGDGRVPVAVDQTSQVVDRLTSQYGSPGQPVVLLTDRYGGVRWHAGGWTALTPTAISDWAGWLRYIDCLCSC